MPSLLWTFLVSELSIFIKSTSDKKCATCALTVTASGKLLTPMLIFKGKPNGWIVKHELPEYPEGCVYACQDNAWMNEQVMLKWVEQILKPYVATAPEDVVPILFLDSYRCHIMASVVNEIQALGVEVEHIPCGCTYLCQPVDIDINQPYKKHLRTRWECWMMAEGLINGTTSPPTRKDITQWGLYAKNEISVETVKNSWRHGEYSWFPNQERMMTTIMKRTTTTMRDKLYSY